MSHLTLGRWRREPLRSVAGGCPHGDGAAVVDSRAPTGTDRDQGGAVGALAFRPPLQTMQLAPRRVRSGDRDEDEAAVLLNAWRSIRALVGMILLVGLVAACTAHDSGAGEVPGQGYVSGDGSVRIYGAENREGPVVVAGTSFEGDRVDSGSWAGEVVVLNTWYASCAPCRAEAPGLVELASELDEVRFVGINTRDDAGAALPFQRTYDVPYPSIEDRSGEVVATLSGVVPLQAVPTTVVLDRNGRVAARVIGQVEKSVLGDLIEEIVSGES